MWFKQLKSEKNRELPNAGVADCAVKAGYRFVFVLRITYMEER
jgi:hypothetical protein